MLEVFSYLDKDLRFSSQVRSNHLNRSNVDLVNLIRFEVPNAKLTPVLQPSTRVGNWVVRSIQIDPYITYPNPTLY